MEDTNKILGKIFGSPARARVLRFFMQNQPTPYTAAVISQKTSLQPLAVTKETTALQSAGILRKKTITVRSSSKGKGKRTTAWYLNELFPYRATFEKFFSDALQLDEPSITKTLLRIGRVKYIAFSGIFTGLPDARVDILVVCDISQPAALARAVRKIENNICRDLKVAFLTTGDFSYRRNVNDKLLRDIFDYPYKVPVDKVRSPFSTT